MNVFWPGTRNIIIVLTLGPIRISVMQILTSIQKVFLLIKPIKKVSPYKLCCCCLKICPRFQINKKTVLLIKSSHKLMIGTPINIVPASKNTNSENEENYY